MAITYRGGGMQNTAAKKSADAAKDKALREAQAKKEAEKEAAREVLDNLSYVPYDELVQGDIADIYGNDVVNDWYDTGLNDQGYLSHEMISSPWLIQQNQLRQADYYDYDPMRQQSMNQLDAMNQSQYQTAMTNVAASQGLTAADRMAMASQFNRDVLSSKGNMLGQYNVEQARNIWETDQANNDMYNSAYLQNIELQNRADDQNIQRLMELRRQRGDLARDLFEKDRSVKAAQEIPDAIS